MRNKMSKRVLAGVLALVMALGMLPAGALAARMDDEPVAAVPAGEEAQVAAPKSGTSRDSAQTLAGESEEADPYAIPGYTLVDAEANALPTGEDNPYLLVAWYGSKPYALYLKEGAASLSDTAGNAFAGGEKSKKSDLTATLTIGGDQVNATYNYNNTNTPVAMDDLHVYFAPTATAGRYTIRSATGYDLVLGTPLASAATEGSTGNAFAVTKMTSETTNEAGDTLRGGYLLKNTVSDYRCVSVLYPSSDAFCLNWCGVGGSGSVNETTGVKTLANNCVFYSRIHLYTKNPDEGGDDNTPTAYTPAEAEAAGLDVHYFGVTDGTFANDTTPRTVTLRDTDALGLVTTPAADTGYRVISEGKIMSAFYTVGSGSNAWKSAKHENYSSSMDLTNTGYQFRLISVTDTYTNCYKLRSHTTDWYMTHEIRSAGTNDNRYVLTGTGETFYLTPATDEGQYYLWWATKSRPGEAISGMFNDAADNTWVFTGGADVAGGWTQTGGKRNFMGHFEEYVRWTYGQSSVGGDSTTKQRYTVNTAYADLTLADIVGDWGKYVAQYNPRAAVYMVGKEDLEHEASFETDLTAFINKAVALRSGDGFAVIMKSYDNSLSALNAAVDTVVEGLKSDTDKYSRVVVADTTLNAEQLTADGHPNAAGHLELSRQLVTAACPNSNTGGNFPAPSGGAGLKTLQEVAAPTTYDTAKVPTVSMTEGTMTVILAGVDAFRYELRLDNGVTISGAGANGSATVTDVPESVGYTLVTRSDDGATQYKTVTSAEAALTELQQTLVDKVNDKTTPLTWLFMGDSITHACHWVSGYDSVAQLTEDYLGTIGRDQDVVINTAVSSATTTSTLDNIQYRLNQFPAPDVASIMLGTNDFGGIDAATTYKTNLNSIITAIRGKNANAIIILRSPTGSWTSRVVAPYCEAMKEVAEAQKCIYIDQYTETQGMLDTYSSWIRNNTTNFPAQVYYGNNLHPGAKAQLDMAKMFFKGTGLWTEDNPISNLDYVLTTAEDSATGVGGALEHTAGTLKLNVGALGGGLGEVTLTATKGGQSWSVTAKAGTDPALTLPNGTYTVTASGIKTNEAKTVTFASAEVKVGEDAPPIEIETSGYPKPNEGKVQNYLDFGSSWVSVTAPAALELYGVSGSTFTKDTNGIDSGVYGIRDATPGDGGAARWLYVAGDVTNQWGGEPEGQVTPLSFTFTYNAEKKAYTIRSVKTGKYLTQGRSNNQFVVNDTPTWFYVSPVNPENNDGTYYIWWETEPQLGGAIGEMFNNDPDNTWVFTGGVDVEGGWAQTKGHRNFMGHFEEYVRGQLGALGKENQAGEGSFSTGRQRYTTNTAYAGLTLHTIVNNWEKHVSGFSPKAAVYMVGSEDANSETFRDDLTSFIDQALALKANNGGFAVIIKSYKDELSALNDAVDSVVEEYQTTAAKKYSHIVVVDALPLTNDQKTADGHPNAAGHSALGEKLVVAVYGSAANYPANGNPNLSFDEKAAPTTYDKATAPTVTWSGDDMTIALTGAFTYTVKQGNGVTVSGTGTGTATVTGLTAGESYTLVTRNTDGTTQYQTVTGLVGGGEVPAKTGDQAKLATLLANNRNNALTWLFMGDSITHGSAHTRGYDSVSQIFDKYLDMIGRPQDVVINSAVSSAETRSTMYAIDYRLKCFPAPDVVAIMLGTNDQTLIGRGAYTLDDYVTYLGQIVTAIREKNEDAIIILRAPTGDYGPTNNRENVWARMKQYATENDLIFVDPNPTFTGYAAYSWTAPSVTPLYFGNALHPGAQGQLAMAQMLIKAAGLWNEDTPIANLEYLRTDMTTETSSVSVSGAVRTNGSELTLSPTTLDANLGRTTLTATNAAGQSWSVTAEAGETPSLTLPDGTYTVAATGVMKNTAKTVTFASAQVEIDADAAPEKLPAPADSGIYEYRLTSGAFTEGTYAIVGTTTEGGNSRIRVMHLWYNSRNELTVDQCQIVSTDTPGGDKLTIDHDTHLLDAARSGDGFTFQVVAGNAKGKYLTASASGVSLGDNGTVFTVTPLDGGGYTLSWNDGGTTRYVSWSSGWNTSTDPYKLNLYKKTSVQPEMAQTHFSGTSSVPMDPANNSYYRIPALITLQNGWIVAASDMRWSSTGDSPNNLDTIVSVSKDGGATWEWEVVNYFSDFAPLQGPSGWDNGAWGKPDSASFIDPALAVDSSGKLWMAVDLQPTHVNLGQAGQKTGSGFDENGLLMVGPISEEEWGSKVGTNLGRNEATRLQYQAYYEYRVDINGTPDGTVTKDGKQVSLFKIFHKDDVTRAATGYYVDAFFDLYYDYDDGGIQPVLVAQKDSDKGVQANLFYKASPWKAYSTTYLMIRTAEVNEETGKLDWSEPKLVSGVKNFNGETFLAFCPGRGTVVTLGGGTERIIFPVYDNVGGEHTSVVYTDDGGATWHRSGRVESGNVGKTSESQVVELPGTNADGTPLLRIYSRNSVGHTSYADSSDGGATWTVSVQDENLNANNGGNGCMVSFINLDGCLVNADGTVYKNLILASYPKGTADGGESTRMNGVVRIGSISGEDGHTVTWLNDEATRYAGSYIYSCLTQLLDEENKPTDGFGLLYEANAADGSRNYIAMNYAALTTADLLGDGWVWLANEPTEDDIPTVTLSIVGSVNTRDADLLDLNVGGQGTITANVTPDEAVVTWSSSDKNVATVADGVVTAVAAGRAVITATTSNKGIIRSVATEVVVTAVDENGAAQAVTVPDRYVDAVVRSGADAYTRYELDTAGDLSGTYVIYSQGNGARMMYNNTSKTDHCQASPSNGVIDSLSCHAANLHLWQIARQTDGTYTIRGVSNNKYLTATADSGQLALSDTPVSFTIEHRGNGTYYVRSSNSYLSWSNGWKMQSGAFNIQLFKQTDYPAQYAYTATTAGLEALIAKAAADEADYEEILALAKAYDNAAEADAVQARISWAAQKVYAGMTGRTFTAQDPGAEPTPTTYTVTFTGEGITESTVTVKEGTTVTLPAPTREGYTFDGWFNGETQFTATTPVNEDLTLTAHWTQNAVEHGDLSKAVVTVTPDSVTSGGTLTVTVSGIPEDVTDVTLTKDGDNVVLTKGEDGVYTGTATAPTGNGQITLVFMLSAADCEAKRVDVSVMLTGGGSTGGNTGGSTSGGSTGGNRPVTPPAEEELEDPDVPLANLPKIFEDVKGGDWFYEAAKFVASEGLMMGVSETSFEPHMNTTRGMIVTILYRMEKEPEVAPTNFLDVAQDSWYSGGAAWGEATGIAKGMTDGNFRAMDDVTREQLAVFLFRFAEHRGYDVTARGDLSVFRDGEKVSGWAEDAMRWAVATGLINGKGAGGLDPLSTATRGEVATILMRFSQNMEGKAAD